MPFTEQLNKEKTIQLYQHMIDKKCGNNDKDWGEIKEDFGLTEHKDVLRKGSAFFSEMMELGLINYYPHAQKQYGKQAKGFDTKGQWSEKAIKVQDIEQLHDIAYILKAHNFDPSQWELVSAQSDYRDRIVKSKKEILVQSKITVRPRKECVSFEAIKQRFQALAGTQALPRLRGHKPHGSYALILPITDLHYGRYASQLISSESYNMDKAEEYFYAVIEDILDYTKNKAVEKIYFPIGNDLINIDNIAGKTNKGTPQDSDGLWQEIVLRCQDMIVKGIGLLADMAPVEIMYVKSNHDTQTSFQMYQYIAAYYRYDDDIFIRQNYTDYNFVRYGKGIFGFAHDIPKKENIHKLFDVYAREWLSDTNYREMFLAHSHTEQIVYDHGGTVIRRLPSLAAPCKWSHENAYVGNVKRCQSFLVDKELGVTDVHYTVIR